MLVWLGVIPLNLASISTVISARLCAGDGKQQRKHAAFGLPRTIQVDRWLSKPVDASRLFLKSSTCLRATAVHGSFRLRLSRVTVARVAFHVEQSAQPIRDIVSRTMFT